MQKSDLWEIPFLWDDNNETESYEGAKVFDHNSEGMLVIHLYLNEQYMNAPRFSLSLEHKTFLQLKF
jgi:hypothetical protein